MKYTSEQKKKFKDKKMIGKIKINWIIPIRIKNDFYVVESKMNFVDL